MKEVVIGHDGQQVVIVVYCSKLVYVQKQMKSLVRAFYRGITRFYVKK